MAILKAGKNKPTPSNPIFDNKILEDSFDSLRNFNSSNDEIYIKNLDSLGIVFKNLQEEIISMDKIDIKESFDNNISNSPIIVFQRPDNNGIYYYQILNGQYKAFLIKQNGEKTIKAGVIRLPWKKGKNYKWEAEL